MDFNEFTNKVAHLCFADLALNICPFCGSKNVLLDVNRYYYDKPYIVRCKSCNAQGPNKETDKEAVEAWNSNFRK